MNGVRFRLELFFIWGIKHHISLLEGGRAVLKRPLVLFGQSGCIYTVATVSFNTYALRWQTFRA